MSVRAERHEWARLHRAPLIASVITIVVGMNYVVLWPALRLGRFGIFYAPSDLWGSYLGAIGLVHGHFQSPFLGMVGSLVIEAPAAAVGSALHLEVGPPYAPFSAPTGWALMGPWMLLLSCTAFFGFDAAGRRLGLSDPKRIALGVVEALLVLNVTAVWGHPEDAVALGLAVFALLYADRGRLGRAGWILGAAIAVQPMAVLVLPATAMLVLKRHGRTEAQRLGIRALLPYIGLLVPPLVAHFSATVHWLVQQPNWPAVNHPTPFTTLASSVAHSQGAVTAGPARLVGILLAVALAIAVCRTPSFGRCLWAAAAGFFLWVATDSVVDAYYTWPVLALVVLLAARKHWAWGAAAAALAGFATWFSNLAWTGSWSWWTVMMLTLAVALAIAWSGSNEPLREDRRSMATLRPFDPTDPQHDPADSAAAVPRQRGTASIPPWTG